MLENLGISENCCKFIVFKYKEIQTIIAMITEDKITELFCMADGFCVFFDVGQRFVVHFIWVCKKRTEQEIFSAYEF